MQQEGATTGTKDVVYNLISVLYHALQGAENYAIYANDAEQAGDRDLASFFRDIHQEEKRRADRAKELLTKKLSNK